MIHLIYLSDIKWWNVAILPKNQQKSVFLISGDLAGSGRDYQNWLKIHSFKWLWCSRTIVSYIWSIRAHFGKNLKNRKKSHFWFTKKWQNFVNGRFFKKYVSGQNDCFTPRTTLVGPPNPTISAVATTHPCMYITLFMFEKIAQNRLFFTFCIENHLST